MKILSRLLLLQIFLVLNGQIVASSGRALVFENMGGQRGLPENIVLSILQDKEGFIWFGTREGLFRFDGHTAASFQHDPTNPENSLPYDVIFDLYEDHKGRLWAATVIGIVKVDKMTGKGKLYQPAPNEPHRLNIIKSITGDSHGIIWLGTESGLARFDPETEVFEVFATERDVRFPIVKVDANDKIWGIKPEGLYYFDPLARQFYLYPILDNNGGKLTPSAMTINSKGTIWLTVYNKGLYSMDIQTPGKFNPVALDKTLSSGVNHLLEVDGCLWVSTESGLEQIDLSVQMFPKKLTKFQSDPNSYGSLNSSIVHATYKDRTGSLWIGTLYGVSKVNLNSNPFHIHQITPTPTTSHRNENQIHQILKDQRGVLWLAADDLGLCQYDEVTGQVKTIPFDPVKPTLSYPGLNWPIVEDKSGQVWAGTATEKALFLWDSDNEAFIRYPCEIGPTAMTVAPSGEIWMGSVMNGIASFDPKSESFTYFKPSVEKNELPVGTRIFDMMASRSGAIWIVAAGMGAIKLEPSTGKFIRYNLFEESHGQRLNDMAPLCVFEDSKGIIWLGTTQGGLNRIDPNSGQVSFFTINDGLSSNRVTSILEDGFGYLWLGTNKGLCRYDPSTKAFRNFEKSDGIPTSYFLDRSAFAKNGILYFGTPHGFISFDPLDIEDVKLDLPVYMTKVKAHEKVLSFHSDFLEVPYEANFLSFEFTAINYHSPDKVHFAYQLEGIDPDWVYSGNRKFAAYSQLRPGKYIFKVKASNDSRTWGNSFATLEFKILPPWWLTWWAYLLYGILILIGFYFLRSYSVRKEKLRHELELKQIEAKKMKEVDHLKSRFFANISHEFRTPLTLILGPLKKMEELAYGKEKEVFQMMLRNSLRLQHLINQLLDLSKLETGNMKLEMKPAALTTFLKVLVLSFSSLAERKQVNYVLRYPTDNPMFYFDADKLEKIIVNLISNAFKFSQQGGEIKVTAKLLPFEKPSLPKWAHQKGMPTTLNILEFKVADKGEGIAADELEKIFDRFYQIESLNQDREGTGIGLSLVKELVELYEGEITVESELEKGTCFVVHLPMPKVGLEELAVVDLEDSKEINQQDVGHFLLNEGDNSNETLQMPTEDELPIVLVVEDNRDIRQFIKEILDQKYKVLEAENGEEGFEMAMETIPDLILSDVMMPRINGVELCKILKNEEKTAHIPLILLTAKASGDSKIEGLETGADDYIIKPFESDVLLIRIKNLINNRKKMREFFSREILLQPAAVAITPVDEKFLSRIMQVMEQQMGNTVFGVEAL
ncbi:MAG: two-component regulator propeller domain-containing protein [Cyclobacteriaceae bacterium]